MICNCFTCSLGKDCYEKRIDLYEHLREPPDYEEIVYSIWCDKVGSKCGWYGYCEDAFAEEIKLIHKENKKRSSKRTRQEKYQNHLKYLSEIANYPTPSMLIIEKWDIELLQYVKLDVPYYKRCYRGNHSGSRYRFYKKYANKIVRRYSCDLHNGGLYKREYDFWWEVD